MKRKVENLMFFLGIHLLFLMIAAVSLIGGICEVAYWFFTNDKERVKERTEIGIFLVGITLLFMIVFAIKVFFVVKIIWLIFVGVFVISALASQTILKIENHKK
jgi:hypothetical protein